MEIFKKQPKKQPSLKRPKSTLAQMALSSNQYTLIVQKLEKILVQKAAPKVHQWPSYGNFGKVTQNPHFLKKEQRVDQGKFVKNRPKSSPRCKSPEALWRKWHYPLISIHLKKKTGEDLSANSGSKRARMAKFWQFLEGHPKPAFSEKVQRGDQEKFFKNRQESSPRFNGPKALWHKCPYPLNCIHL